MRHIFTEDELKKLCAFWQNQLKLNNWRIAIGIERKTAFNNSQSTGEIEFVSALNKAVIKILDPSDYPQSPFEQDMEISLVHELLHLHFALFEPKSDDSLEFLIMESTIEQLANILVEMKRTNMQGSKIKC